MVNKSVQATKQPRRKHDELIKAFLIKDLNEARKFLKIHLPKDILDRCKLETLQIKQCAFVEEDLRSHSSDMLYKVDLVDGNVAYILLEAQSEALRIMPFRVLRYQTAIILQDLTDNLQTDARVKLPLIWTLVFYNGNRSPYPYSCSVADLFGEQGLYHKSPLGIFDLIDVTIIPDDQLLTHGTIGLLEVIKKYSTIRKLLKRTDVVAEAFKVAFADGLTPALFNSALSYLYSVGNKSQLQPLLDKIITTIPDHKEDIMNYAQELRQEGEKIGKKKGEKKGIQIGKQEGIQIGKQEGVQIGRQEAQSDIAKKLLAAHVDYDTIVQATGVTLPEIKKLKKQLVTKH